FELALEEYEDWEQEFGEPIGINLLGVGDANNDGVFDENDLDGFVDIIVGDPKCAPGFGGTQCGSESEEFQGGGSGGGDTCADEPTEEDWAHFWSVVNQIRQEYGI
ncbi:MAG: hypothetical protein JNG88_20030, partial [Phycisphaerales bacterium]|nr:hypothetical protein [Phycisphaerales bacterium]